MRTDKSTWSYGSDAPTAKAYFGDPSRYVAKNPYIELRSELIAEMIPRFNRKTLLDLGAGDGRVSIPLAGTADHLTLVDASPRMLELAKKNTPSELAGRVGFVCSDITQYVPPAPFDVVLCIGVLAHLPDWREAVTLIGSCMATGGVAVVQLTDDSSGLGWLTSRVFELKRAMQPRTVHRLARIGLDEVQAEFGKLGIELRDARRYVFVPGLRCAPAFVRRSVAVAGSSWPFARAGGEVLAMFARSEAVLH